MTNTANNQPSASKTPSHFAYTVREITYDESYWTRIGAVWPHADGNGSTLQLEALPSDGRIVIRVASEKKK